MWNERKKRSEKRERDGKRKINRGGEKKERGSRRERRENGEIRERKERESAGCSADIRLPLAGQIGNKKFLF